jgi:hypothetical protein
MSDSTETTKLDPARTALLARARADGAGRGDAARADARRSPTAQVDERVAEALLG